MGGGGGGGGVGVGVGRLCLSDVGGDDVGGDDVDGDGGGDDGTAALTVHATTGSRLQPAARSKNTSALGRTREISQCPFVKKFPTESTETTDLFFICQKVSQVQTRLVTPTSSAAAVSTAGLEAGLTAGGGSPWASVTASTAWLEAGLTGCRWAAGLEAGLTAEGGCCWGGA